MTEERTNTPEGSTDDSPALGGQTRRKGGGNGSSRRKPVTPPPGTVNVPEGLFLWINRASTDEIKILFWLAYCWAKEPEVWQQLETIAPATGLSQGLAFILLRQLVSARRVVEYHPEGFKLADLTPDQWMPDD